MSVFAWHFTGDKLRDGSPIPPVGEWLEYKGLIVMCQSGLHASRDPFDALRYAPGPILHFVECDGVIHEDKDKLVCSRRKIIASKDATEGLQYFARIQALSVYENMPNNDVILEWLMTGNPTISSTAESAAWSAAESAARSAAWSAAESAAWSAARSAAWSAARSAAWSAAESAAWSASESAAWSVARSVAWSAAREEWNKLVKEAFE